MRRLIVAELRQLLWVQFLTLGTGISMFGLIAFATRQFPTNADSPGVILNYVLTMLICAAPVLINWVHDWDRNRNGRLTLIETLPLSQWQLDLSRLLAALLCLWPALLAWIPLWVLLISVYGATSAWVALWVALLVVLILLTSMRQGWVVMATYAFLSVGMVPLYFLTGLKPLVQVPLSFIATPWASVALALLTIVVVWRLSRHRGFGDGG